MLRIAIAKGRLMDSLINYLDVIEYTTLSETLKNRERQLLLSVDNIECILVKGSDVPIYVEQGIAGLRLGVLMSTAETIQRIQKIEHPYPLNVFTLNIATYIFRHREETRQFLTMQRQLAEQLKQIFDTHVADKMSVFPSNANFVLTKGSAAQQLGQYVYEQGFKPRFYDEPVMKGYVRYSIATASQLKQLEEIVKEWSAKYDLSKTTKHS